MTQIDIDTIELGRVRRDRHTSNSLHIEQGIGGDRRQQIHGARMIEQKFAEERANTYNKIILAICCLAQILVVR